MGEGSPERLENVKGNERDERKEKLVETGQDDKSEDEARFRKIKMMVKMIFIFLFTLKYVFKKIF